MRASCGGATFEIRPKRGFIPPAEFKRLIAEGWQSSRAERAFLRVTVDEGAHPSFVDILKIGALHLKTSPREDGLVWCELEPRLYVRGLQVDMQLAGFVWMPNKCWGKALPASELAELEAAASLVEADVRHGGVESFSGRCAEPDTLAPPLPDAHEEHTFRSLAGPLPRHAGEIQLTFYRWEDPENRVTRQLQDQAQDPTFLKRSAEYGNKIKFMSDNDLYELGKDDAPNWPLPPKPFQKGIVADRNPYRIFGLAEFD